MDETFKKALKDLEKLSFYRDIKYLLASARDKGLPTTILYPEHIILGQGCFQRRMFKKTSELTSLGAINLATNKKLTNFELRRLGLPVPNQIIVNSFTDLLTAANRLGCPVVIKPLNTDKGLGVTIGMNKRSELKQAYEIANKYSQHVLVESFIEGYDYRIQVIDGRMVGAAKRIPANVVGDGIHTVQELREAQNSEEKRGYGNNSPLQKYAIDEEALKLIKLAGFSLDSIPPNVKRVYLREAANLSLGGTARNDTSLLHPDNKVMAELAAQALGLDIAGIDFIKTDISKSWKETNGKICEVNVTPGFRSQYSPTEGEPIDVATPIFDMLFPNSKQYTVSTAVVTGSNGKTTTCRLVAHIL